MAVDVYLKGDVQNILRALALSADRYHPDYALALLQVGMAFGIEKAEPVLMAPTRQGEAHRTGAPHLQLYHVTEER
jgi:hypothetical protein